ncbi:hypothetical protein LNV09_18305 [Paucibacter sp. B2R-40]|nr:hypothetical protein [Paucibacter sp. B2R-40]
MEAKKMYLPALLLGLFAWPLTAAASTGSSLPDTPALERIVWMKADAKAINPATAYLVERLPAIQHEYLSVNALRSWQMIERGEHACRPLTVRTAQRELQAYFADTHLAPPAELIVRRDKLALVPRNAAGEVDLGLLINKGALRGAYARGRSYGEAIDRLLASQGQNKQLVDYSMAGYGSRLQDMLARDRADYLIESNGALAQMSARNIDVKPFVDLPIQGASEPLVLGIACPRTAWGLAAVKAIDQVLGTPAGAAHMRKTSADWFSGAALERLKPQIEQFYLRRSKPHYSD